ncbi:MAG: hypothetical protein S0880_28335 [Actinomycetota bacterium]|nr:hypothetical protein [Actinomycetota bacterium]
MAWIRTVDPDDADGQLREAYDWQASVDARPSGLIGLGSLHPPLVVERLRLARVGDDVPSSLTPVDRHLAAFVVALLCGSPSGADAAREALGRAGCAPELVARIEASPELPSAGDRRVDAVCSHAAKLTLLPGSMTAGDIRRLRDAGLDDLDLLDLNNVVAYHNYVNRVMVGLGLDADGTSPGAPDGAGDGAAVDGGTVPSSMPVEGA